MRAAQPRSATTQKEHIMKKLTTAVLGAAMTAPVVLFAGAGTAQAATAWAWPDSDPLGVTMHIQSTGAWGWCEYTAVPVGGGLKPLPAYKVPFHLDNGQESTLWFPGIPTGTTWNVTITCEHGGLNNSQVLY
jgi:hypothetical protein